MLGFGETSLARSTLAGLSVPVEIKYDSKRPF
jgi:hypothetical protein